MNKYKIEIKWALIFAVMFLLWMVMEKAAGFHDKRIDQQQFIGMFILIPSIIIYILMLLEKKKKFYFGKMSYKQGFISGLVFTVFMLILSPFNQLITSYIISPNYFTNAIAHTVKSGMFTKEQAEQQFNITNYIIISVVAGLITGAIFSAIIALFIKSKRI